MSDNHETPFPGPDPDWSHGISHGFRPYHLHMSYDDLGSLPPDDQPGLEAWMAPIYDIVRNDGFRVWDKASRIEQNGSGLFVITVLVRYAPAPNLAGVWVQKDASPVSLEAEP